MDLEEEEALLEDERPLALRLRRMRCPTAACHSSFNSSDDATARALRCAIVLLLRIV